MPENKIIEVVTYRAVLAIVSTIVIILIMRLLNGFDRKFKSLFLKTDDHDKRITTVETKCEERYK